MACPLVSIALIFIVVIGLVAAQSPISSPAASSGSSPTSSPATSLNGGQLEEHESWNLDDMALSDHETSKMALSEQIRVAAGAVASGYGNSESAVGTILTNSKVNNTSNVYVLEISSVINSENSRIESRAVPRATGVEGNPKAGIETAMIDIEATIVNSFDNHGS